LIQKALAKLHGGYDALKGIQVCEAMRDLTGAPAYTYDVNTENLVNDLVVYNDKRYVMVCSLEEAYHSILDVQKISDSQGKDVTLLKLRNPTGESKWTGDWSDTSDKWTAEIKEKVGWTEPTGPNRGIFWMDFDDVKK